MIFKRNNNDNKGWWHWRPQCLIYQNGADQKQRGDTFTYLEVEDGYPTTYALCPACLAEDKRRRTRDQAVFVKRADQPKFENRINYYPARRD
jgi:hypothetical protein